MGSLADCLKKMRSVFPEGDRLELMAAAKKTSERDAVQSALDEARADLQEVETAIRGELGMPGQAADQIDGVKKADGLGGRDRLDAKTSPLEEARNSMATDANNRFDLRQTQALLDVIDNLLLIKPDTLSTAQPSNLVEANAAPSERLLQRVMVDTKALRNIIRGKAFLQKGFGGLDGKAQRLVLSHMLSLSQNGKVLDTVVQLIPVEMVNNFATSKFPAEVLLDSPTMLKGAIAENLRLRVSIPVNVTDALMRALTLGGAIERAGLTLPDLVGPSLKSSVTGGTQNRKHRNIYTRYNREGQQAETKETDQGVALFDERQGPVGPPTMEQFKEAWKTGATIAGTTKKVVDSSHQYPADLIEDLAKQPYVKKLTNSIGVVFKEMSGVLKASDPNVGAPSFVGLSPDDYYVGVNLRGPDAVMLNPWGAMWRAQQHIQANDLSDADANEYLASTLLKTMVHELTHQQVEGHDAQFDEQLEQNYDTIGMTRLAAWQRLLMRTIEGETDAISRDLRTQQAFWSQRDRLSNQSRSRDAESGPIFDRQDVAGEGTRGRTGPTADLFGRRAGEAPTLDRSPGLQRSGTDTGTIDPPTAKARLNAAKPSLRPYLLGALGLEQIAQVYGKDHAEVTQYNKATQAMEADFVEMSRSSEQIVKSWTALKIPIADQMAKVMEEARFLNFDPDPTKKQEADSQKKKDVRKRFEELPAEAQATYRLARDFYMKMAETRFQALKERIERAGGTPENTKKLVDRLQIAYEQVRSKVYFPFTRFGENIVVAKQMKDGKEVDREVHAFESKLEAQQFAMHMKMKGKGWTVKQTVAKEYSLDKEGPASKIVRQMHDIIKELDERPGLPWGGNMTEQLLDSLNQSFLQALPDMSYAKHFIHAKDVKGASKDALRAFAHSALHGAHHISRIKHADKVTNALMKLDERINETGEGDVTEARQVYNELIQRHNEILNPSTHPFAAWLGQLGFTMSLGGVVATGITNATQVPLVTYPWLGARYGFGKASTALARAYKDFLDPRTFNKDSLFDATQGLEKEIARLEKIPDTKKRVAELKDEVAMLKELARRGRIDLTQTMDLAGLSAQDNLSRKARLTGTLSEKVTKMLGFTFHAPEVMNRQVTALSTFRLEKERGGSFDEALQRAEQAIIDTHFIYTSDNRPRYMSGNVLRVLTMFKQYSQNIAYTYGRAASIWLDKNNATAEERTVAKRQLISMLALQFGAAGALGMPFFGSAADVLMAVVNAFGDDDDKRDWEVALRKWLDGSATSLAEAFIDDKDQAREVGREIAEVVSHGASRLTPWDMAGRLGQGDLFFREPQREREGRSAVMDWMLALGGPVPSYGVNLLLGMGDVAKGVTDLNAGFFLRGVEELTPAVLRNGVKSLRYVLEDVRTRDQYKQLELGKAETLGQAFGFTPSRVAEMYESTTAVKNKEHRVINQRKALLDRFARAVSDEDDAAKELTIDAIQAYNEREPMFAITSNTLNRSLKTRAQREAGMERGMYLPPRRRALLEEGDWADF